MPSTRPPLRPTLHLLVPESSRHKSPALSVSYRLLSATPRPGIVDDDSASPPPTTMPTPANQPPDRSPPPSYSISSCPDDVQIFPQPTRQSRVMARLRPDSTAPSRDRSSALESQDSRDGLSPSLLLASSTQSPVEPSSRGTTISPAPPPGTTEVAFPPLPGGSDGDVVETESQETVLSSNLDDSNPSAASRRQVDGRMNSSPTRDLDSHDLSGSHGCETSQSLPMESEFPYARVSCSARPKARQGFPPPHPAF